MLRDLTSRGKGIVSVGISFSHPVVSLQDHCQCRIFAKKSEVYDNISFNDIKNVIYRQFMWQEKERLVYFLLSLP